jgi:hypothetical protein
MNPIHTFLPYFPNIHSNIIFHLRLGPPSSLSSLQVFRPKLCTHFTSLSCSAYGIPPLISSPKVQSCEISKDAAVNSSSSLTVQCSCSHREPRPSQTHFLCHAYLPCQSVSLSAYNIRSNLCCPGVGAGLHLCQTTLPLSWLLVNDFGLSSDRSSILLSHFSLFSVFIVTYNHEIPSLETDFGGFKCSPLPP